MHSAPNHELPNPLQSNPMYIYMEVNVSALGGAYSLDNVYTLLHLPLLRYQQALTKFF